MLRKGTVLGRLRGVLLAISVFALTIGTAPLYAAALYCHPYYDDYGFSAAVRQTWTQTGSVAQALQAALQSAAQTRQTWQGTYTGTLLSNVQPGVFSEGLYFLGCWLILTAFIGGWLFFLLTVLARLGLRRGERWTLSCLAVTVMVQFMPDVREAFFWFNGGIGNVFIYALLAIAFALTLRLLEQKRPWAMLGLVPLMVALGGGSYGGGLFGLCVYAVGLAWLIWRRHPRRWHVAALFLLFLGCFLYSVSAPGNAVRSTYLGPPASPVVAVGKALYYGVAQMGTFLRLPVIGITLPLLPALWRAAGESRFSFAHPWLCVGLLGGLYCAQLVPPLYAGVGVGAGRIVNTYFISFVALWFLAVYYLLGFLYRRGLRPNARSLGALTLAGVCALGLGALAVKPDGEDLYGAQHLSGPSAALSLVTGQAARYDREMRQREALLNDPAQDEVTLAPLTSVPAVFMPDLLTDETSNVHDMLCRYYNKRAIYIAGEEETP